MDLLSKGIRRAPQHPRGFCHGNEAILEDATDRRLDSDFDFGKQVVDEAADDLLRVSVHA